jgi:hypothetical protein
MKKKLIHSKPKPHTKNKKLIILIKIYYNQIVFSKINKMYKQLFNKINNLSIIKFRIIRKIIIYHQFLLIN